jgi:hypothetical protein
MKKLLIILLGAFIWLITFFQVPIWAEEPKNILSIEAYDMLNTVPNTYLIDVRTRAEYQLFQKTNNLLILCRDGSRSILAAKELIKNDFKHVYNVKDGFEGPLFPSFEDKNRHKFYRQLAHRNKIPDYNHRRFYGWQWWGLPWTYDIDPKYIYPPDKIPKEKKK